jgi:hypothetical protein
MIIEDRNDENILFFAFRYALGRKTAAVSITITKLKENWHVFPEHEQKQIFDEIERHYGMSMNNSTHEEIYKDQWYAFIDWAKTKNREDKIDSITES